MTGQVVNYPLSYDKDVLKPVMRDAYIDYQADKEKYIDNFWRIVNWDVVNDRL